MLSFFCFYTFECPSQVLHGGDDTFIPLEHGLETACAIPNAQVMSDGICRFVCWSPKITSNSFRPPNSPPPHPPSNHSSSPTPPCCIPQPPLFHPHSNYLFLLQFAVIDGMGHDFPPSLVPSICDRIIRSSPSKPFGLQRLAQFSITSSHTECSHMTGTSSQTPDAASHGQQLTRADFVCQTNYQISSSCSRFHLPSNLFAPALLMTHQERRKSTIQRVTQFFANILNSA
jgi:hypothetical protein